LTAASSQGFVLSHTFEEDYFKYRPYCTFGYYSGMGQIHIKNISKNVKDVGMCVNCPPGYYLDAGVC
jgi:hypothetical protein